jgi:hypothetical protein
MIRFLVATPTDAPHVFAALRHTTVRQARIWLYQHGLITDREATAIVRVVSRPDCVEVFATALWA